MDQPPQWALRLWNEHADRIRGTDMDCGVISANALHDIPVNHNNEESGSLISLVTPRQNTHSEQLVRFDPIGQAAVQRLLRYDEPDKMDIDVVTPSEVPSSPSYASTIADTEDERRILDEKGRQSYQATNRRATDKSPRQCYLQPDLSVKSNCRHLIASAMYEKKDLQEDKSLRLLGTPHILDGIHWSRDGLKLRASFQPVVIGYRDYLSSDELAGLLPSNTYVSSITYLSGNRRLSEETHLPSMLITHVEVQWRPQYFYVQKLDSRLVEELLTRPQLQCHLLYLEAPKDFLLWRNDLEMLDWDGVREYHLCLKTECKVCSI